MPLFSMAFDDPSFDERLDLMIQHFHGLVGFSLGHLGKRRCPEQGAGAEVPAFSKR